MKEDLLSMSNPPKYIQYYSQLSCYLQFHTAGQFIATWRCRIRTELPYIHCRYTFLPVEPHEAVPEVSKGKVHITQNKHVPIEWFVTTASQSRI